MNMYKVYHSKNIARQFWSNSIKHSNKFYQFAKNIFDMTLPCQVDIKIFQKYQDICNYQFFNYKFIYH